MADQPYDSGELSGFERALSSLTPQRSGVDRDRLMFLAGQVAGSRSSGLRPRGAWLWPAMTGFSTAAAVLLSVLLVAEHNRVTSGPVVQVRVPNGPRLPQGQKADGVSGKEEVDSALARDDRGWDDRPPMPLATGPALASARWMQLRQAVLAHGLNGLPAPQYDDLDGDIEARTVWDESKRLLGGNTDGRDGDLSHGSAYSNWTTFFLPGENL